MNYSNINYQNKLTSKVNLADHNSNWIIAKMLCHMKDTTEIDTRTVFITIHVNNIKDVDYVASHLFQLAESYLAHNMDDYIPLHRRPALAWCADFEGTTKLRGSTKPGKPHLHAALIVPKASIARIPSLISYLDRQIKSLYGVASFVGGSTPVHIRAYDHTKRSKTMNSTVHHYSDFIGYITKAENLFATSNQKSDVIINSNVLPYDELNDEFKSAVEIVINNIMKNVSSTQRRFKYFRYS